MLYYDKTSLYFYSINKKIKKLIKKKERKIKKSIQKFICRLSTYRSCFTMINLDGSFCCLGPPVAVTCRRDGAHGLVDVLCL